MFEANHYYTREKIHNLLGGGLVDYLPRKHGQIVCGCFREDANRDAPNIILPGNGPKIQKSAKIFREQRYPIPIFIKRNVNSWEYVGDYKVERWTDDASEIAKYAKLSGRTDVTSVLFLKQY
jgi:hypothetical protein